MRSSKSRPFAVLATSGPEGLDCSPRGDAPGFVRIVDDRTLALPGEHELLARHFAGMTQVPMEERFGWPIWDEGTRGVPVLRDALASLQGEIVDLKEVGSHSVMFVKTTRISVRSDGDGLIYFDRNFHRIKRVASH